MQQRLHRLLRLPVPLISEHFIDFLSNLLRSGRVQPGNLLNEKQKLNLIYPILKKNKECSAEIAKSFLDAIAYYKNTGEKEKTLEKIPEEWKNCFPQIYREYESARTKVRGVDFDDMLKECEELLQNNTPQREYWQKRFSHILIDEFQDINYRQYCIVRLLAERHKNVFAVGDDDQAIYSFRGARPACMQMFVREFAATQILLRTNYRSHQDIVEASLLVINENLDRFPKILEASELNQRKKETYRGNRLQGKNKRIQGCTGADAIFITSPEGTFHTGDLCNIVPNKPGYAERGGKTWQRRNSLCYEGKNTKYI